MIVVHRDIIFRVNSYTRDELLGMLKKLKDEALALETQHDEQFNDLKRVRTMKGTEDG
jgi:hypothetical protein